MNQAQSVSMKTEEANLGKSNMIMNSRTASIKKKTPIGLFLKTSIDCTPCGQTEQT